MYVFPVRPRYRSEGFLRSSRSLPPTPSQAIRIDILRVLTIFPIPLAEYTQTFSLGLKINNGDQSTNVTSGQRDGAFRQQDYSRREADHV